MLGRCRHVGWQVTHRTCSAAQHETAGPSYQKKMKTAHGDVHEVNKTTLKKLNKVLKKKGKLEKEDFEEVKFKNKIDLTNHKPVVKKKW